MYYKQRKIPAIVGILVISSVLFIVTYIDRFHNIFNQSNTSYTKAEDIKITNISFGSFTVSWFTSKPAIGLVKVIGNTHTIYLDDLDNDNIGRPRTSHYVTIKNLNENTLYSLKVINDNLNCNDDIACPTITQKTVSKVAAFYSLPPAQGTVLNTEGKSAENAIIYLTLGNNMLLSGRTDSMGLWVIPLNNLHSKDFHNITAPNDNENIYIQVKYSKELSAQATIDVKSVKQNVTIPPITIGKIYNFIGLSDKKAGTASASKESNILGAQSNKQKLLNEITPTIPKVTKSGIDILFPAESGDTTPDNQPQLRGVGTPNKTLTITVNSVTQATQIVVGADGTWNWRPPKPLPPGQHTITIQSYENGKLITMKKTFIVLKSGEQVLGEATESASLTPTKSPTPSTLPSLTPTEALLTPTLTVTITPSATPTITLTPPATPTTFIITSTPTIVPRSGSVSKSVFFIGMGLAMVMAGLNFLILRI